MPDQEKKHPVVLGCSLTCEWVEENHEHNDLRSLNFSGHFDVYGIF